MKIAVLYHHTRDLEELKRGFFPRGVLVPINDSQSHHGIKFDGLICMHEWNHREFNHRIYQELKFNQPELFKQ